MEIVTTTLQSIASQMEQLAQQMLQQSVIMTELSKKLGSKGVTLEGKTSSGDSVQSEIEETEKMKLDFDLNSSTKEKEEVSLLTGTMFSRLMNFQSSPENIHTESSIERKGKQEATITQKPPLNLSYPPSTEPPPDSGQPVTTVPRRAPPPKPPDLHDFVDGEVYAKSSVKKRGKVQMSLGGPPLKSSEPPYSGCNSVHVIVIVAEGEKVLKKAGAKREIGELCITLNLMGHMHKYLPPIFYLLHVSSSGQHSTLFFSHGSLNSLSVMCHADTMQCELGQFYNQKGQAQTNIWLLKNEFRWMVINFNVSAAQIWSTTKTKATGNDIYQLHGVHYCLVFDHVISETSHHRRSTWQEVHTRDFSNLMILFTKHKQFGVDRSKAAEFLFKHKLADSLVYSLLLGNFTCLKYTLVPTSMGMVIMLTTGVYAIVINGTHLSTFVLANVTDSSQAKYSWGYGIERSGKLIQWVKGLLDGPNKFLCPSLVIRLVMQMLTLILVMKYKGEDGNLLMSEITQQWILMNVFKFSRIMFDVVVISILEVPPSFLSLCDDSLVLPIGENMHVYMVGFYDDKSVFWKTALIEKDSKYEHVSRTYRACIQIGAKLHNLVVLNAMMCGYGSKVHFVPSFNMISWCSSFFMNQQDSREFDFPMVVADNETGWIMFFTLNGLLNFVFDRGKFGAKERCCSKGCIFQP